jgi:hypothetical protein
MALMRRVERDHKAFAARELARRFRYNRIAMEGREFIEVRAR